MAKWRVATLASFIVVLLFQLTTEQYTSMQQNKNTYESKSVGELTETTTTKSNKTEVVLLLLMSNQTELPIFFELLKPAVELAAEYVNSRYSDFSVKIRSRKDVNTCDGNVLGAIAAEEYYRGQLNGLVGPICSKALEAAARLASYWGMPIITAGGIGVEFSNKRVYKTLTRIAFSLDRVADFFSKVVQDYDWHHLSFIVDESEPMNVLTKVAFEKMFRSMDNYKIYLDIQEFTRKYTGNSLDEGVNYDKLLLNSKKASRVFVLLVNGEMSRNFLVHAHDLGMANGEYVFFGVELVKSAGENNDFSWYKAGDKNNRKSKLIYESFLSLAVRVPTSAEYNLFASKVYERASEEFTVNALNINPMVAAFYDAVMIYAWAYNKSLHLRENIPYNEKIKKLLWNNVFTDALTGDIVINENGDREFDYTMSDFNPETGMMQPILSYFGRRRQVEKVEGVVIHWPNNAGPPPDVPYCGFSGEALHCMNQEILPVWAVILISLTVTVSISTVVIFFVFKRVRAEQDLASNWWIIDYNEIIFPFTKGHKSSMSQATSVSGDGLTSLMRSGKSTSLQGHTRASTYNSLISAAGQIDSVMVGSYRGVKIAYKPLEIKRINMNRKMLLEFRQMRDVTHENLVRFMGICMDDQNTAIVTELMIRGSLRDILDAEKMHIDWTFRYSMISDIIEGMIFLHQCPIQYHGHLKSTNCVVDGRFMVKIADYGLRSLHKQVTREHDINPSALFWTAPEHLRSSDPINHGSKAGDIFSFAIILKEIITRTHPYESVNKEKFVEPKEILDKVRMGIIPPYRPEIVSPDCPTSLLKVVNVCWAEDPSKRPEFSKLKPVMRKISQGVSSANFLDNLLNRMEQYSSNLERIVEEKTQSIQEEQMKTDELLYQILPKYIATELKCGRHVQPEMFDSTTIFFSDIVGFTVLSSLSSPMQVVSLLNDLYSTFDSIINTFDAYKIETIGDAYMVASGVPIRNGREHSKEIAMLALEMLGTVDKFKIRHLPQTKLRLRIGIHSGSVAAGVVGTKMPKYLVFGDTVNIASQLESSGEPLKIHVSEDCKKLLDSFNIFNLTTRGEMEIKGKGIENTYWLDSCNLKNPLKQLGAVPRLESF